MGSGDKIIIAYHGTRIEQINLSQSEGNKADYRMVFREPSGEYTVIEPENLLEIGTPIDSESGDDLMFIGAGFVVGNT